MRNKILSLSALKMEKNFIAVNEKGYPRKPYLTYSIFDPVYDGRNIIESKENTLLGFVHREMNELNTAVEWAILHNRTDTQRDSIYEAMEEIADVSNCLDYLFEALLDKLLGVEE